MGRILPRFAYHFINSEQYVVLYSCLLQPFRSSGCRICKGGLPYQSRVCKFPNVQRFHGIQ